MALAHDLSSRELQETAGRRCAFIREALIRDGLHDATSERADGDPAALTTRWRIAPSCFLISPSELAFFRTLGSHLLAFYRALNRLYHDSVHGSQPAWVSECLDQGKPESLVAYSRMKRFRDLLPGIIRPDIIPVENGMIMTELDSVPGGIGLLGSLSKIYHEMEGETRKTEVIGGPHGMVSGFAAMIRHRIDDRSGCLAIVVSEEAKDYRPEMIWLAARLRAEGLESYCVGPREIRFTEEALMISGDRGDGDRLVSALYRFFELFDLKNVPKSELIMYSAKKDQVVVTPPFKPALEEKSAFALFHHPILRPFWQRELGDDTWQALNAIIPRTWVLDPRPLPPAAVIPNLQIGDRAIADWRDLAEASQKDRRYVIKPSGFSELAWGSRGVSVGHDLPQPKWAERLESALNAFPATPHVLQEFHKGRQFNLSYYDPQTDAVVPMAGRARLPPYYFVTGNRAELAGILAT
ncbi:MAG TPA: hypothetical protein VJ692_11180, partial [Nitrospiraceae bacterium]|nr:hypothetical protein [Nitrospiraceae bacterium]